MGFRRFINEALDTPPHLPQQYFNTHLALFKGIVDKLKKFKEDDFEKIVREYVGSRGQNLYYDFERFVYMLNNSLEHRLRWYEHALEEKHLYDVNKRLKDFFEWEKPDLEFDLDLFNDILKEVEDGMKDDYWDEDLGDKNKRKDKLNSLFSLIKDLKHLKKWYPPFEKKLKAFYDLNDRRLVAYYGGKNKEEPAVKEGIETLYHATTSMSGILREGFKTRRELNRGGLGGGPADLISYTADLQIAEAIVWGLKRITEVSQGKMNYNQLMLLADRLGSKDKALEYTTSSHGKYETERQEKNFRYYEIPRSEDKKKEWRFEFFRSLLHFQNKIYNPLFFGVTINDFASINPNDIGVIASEVDMSKVDSYLSSMEEYRVPVSAIGRSWKVPYRGIMK